MFKNMLVLTSVFLLGCPLAVTAGDGPNGKGLRLWSKECPLPPYPEHGICSVMNGSDSNAAKASDDFFSAYKFGDGYEIVGKKIKRYCNGAWCYRPLKHICGTKNTMERSVMGGRKSKNGEVPWNVGVYNKLYTPYKQSCGGTIIRSHLVVTAAHCFWRDLDGLRPASQFAVAAGKIYRPWNNPKDREAQKSEITDIKVPPRFRGGQTNFQDDIALLLLATPFEFNSFVLPACIDFNVKFDREQLRDGNLGTIAGWGLTAVNGRESPILQVVELPYVDVGRCMDEMPPDFRRYITSDKICAGYANGTALCRGDSGGGLTFWIEKKDLKRYYLRGIASTAKHTTNACNALSLTTFTHVLAHEHFIRDYL